MDTLEATAVPAERSGNGRLAALAAFCVATVFLIALDQKPVGALAWLLSAYLVLRQDPAFRRRMGVLLGSVAILSFAPIHTDTSNAHFIALGIPFLAVLVLPYWTLRLRDPGVIRYQIFPRRFRWRDMFYIAISIPLSWAAFEVYFKVVNPEVPSHWFLPAERSTEAVWRLFVGINCVGIWDELFFVNTVFAVLRSIFPYRIANVGQAVVYTSVLYQMAFTGLGPWLIFPFALTQGAMFEGSENLLYVILVHLIVDAFLFAGIVGYYYPGWNPIPH